MKRRVVLESIGEDPNAPAGGAEKMRSSAIFVEISAAATASDLPSRSAASSGKKATIQAQPPAERPPEDLRRKANTSCGNPYNQILMTRQKKMEQLPWVEVVGFDITVASKDEMERRGGQIKIESESLEASLGTVNDPRMGPLGNETCVKCGNFDCGGHFGLIEFPLPIFNPIYLRQNVSVANAVCGSCSQLYLTPSLLQGMPTNIAQRLLAIESKSLGASCARYTNQNELECDKNKSLYKLDGAKILVKSPGSADYHPADPKVLREIFSQISDKTAEMLGFRPGEWAPLSGEGEEVVKNDQDPTDDVTTEKGIWYLNQSNHTAWHRKAKEAWVKMFSFPDLYTDFPNHIVPRGTLFISQEGNLYQYIPGVHPVNMIMTGMLVPPPNTRPPSTEGGPVGHDMITTQLSTIVKTVNKIKEAISNKKETATLAEELQKNIQELQTNSSNQRRGVRDFLAATNRLQGKEGSWRGALMGKRGNFGARAVLGPDVDLKFGQLRVPRSWASILTIPVVVNEFNKDALQNMLISGQITAYFRYDGIENQPIRINDQNRQVIILQPGDIVERHLQTGDRVGVFNRFPTLHRENMMSFEVILGEAQTIGLHLSYTTPYNADFDGDEGNLYITQDIDAMVEAQELMEASQCIMSSEQNRPMMGLVMDSITAAYVLTDVRTEVPSAVFSDCLSLLSVADQLGDLFERLDRYAVSANSGRALFSILLPSDFTYERGDVLIIEGVLLRGQIRKDHVGPSHRSLIQELWKNYGRERTAAFLSDAPKVLQKFLDIRGFTVGARDCTSNHIVFREADEVMMERDEKIAILESKGILFEEHITLQQATVANYTSVDAYKDYLRGQVLTIDGVDVPALLSIRDVEKTISLTTEINVEEQMKVEVGKIKARYAPLQQQQFKGPIQEEARKASVIKLLSSGKTTGQVIVDRIMSGTRGNVKMLNGLLAAYRRVLLDTSSIIDSLGGLLKDNADAILGGLRAAQQLASNSSLRKINDELKAFVPNDEEILKELNGISDSGTLIDQLMKLNVGFVKSELQQRLSAKYFPSLFSAAAPLLVQAEKKLAETRQQRLLASWEKNREKIEERLDKFKAESNRQIVLQRADAWIKLSKLLDDYAKQAAEAKMVNFAADFEAFKSEVTIPEQGEVIVPPADKIKSLLDGIKALGDKLEKSAPLGDNNLAIMYQSGAKGNLVNISQIRTMAGQQFQQGQPLPRSIQGGQRAFPPFDPNEADPEAYGFVGSSYWSGLRASELYSIQAGARESITDTATKTGRTGDLNHKMMKAFENVRAEHDGSVRSTTGIVYQLVYGNNGYEVGELLSVKATGYEDLASFIDLKATVADLNSQQGWISEEAAEIVKQNKKIAGLNDKARNKNNQVFVENITELTSQSQKTRRRFQEWSPDKMTKYERTALLGQRAHMIAQGSKPTVAIGDIIDPIEIARLELKAKKMPHLKVYRRFPNGKVEVLDPNIAQ